MCLMCLCILSTLTLYSHPLLSDYWHKIIFDRHLLPSSLDLLCIQISNLKLNLPQCIVDKTVHEVLWTNVHKSFLVFFFHRPENRNFFHSPKKTRCWSPIDQRAANIENLRQSTERHDHTEQWSSTTGSWPLRGPWRCCRGSPKIVKIFHQNDLCLGIFLKFEQKLHRVNSVNGKL